MITSDVFFDERNRTTERERKRVKKGEIFCLKMKMFLMFFDVFDEDHK